jgi:glycyl-tRNA synthetase beta subunit
MAKAKFDIRTEATRPLYAGVGVTDLAVEFVREYVTDVQKRLTEVQKDVQTRVNDLDFEPTALRKQTVTFVNARVEALTKDARARRAAIEARMEELRADAKEIPTRVQHLLDENIETVNETYTDLAKRGETLVERIRRQQSTKKTVSSAKTTSAKAKTTKTQATKATKTTAKKTASNATQATTDAASKVGD